MLAYSHYETDARVRRYAEALTERGDHVDVVALKRSPDEAVERRVGGVNVYNLQARVGKGERSPLAFLFPVLRFLSASMFWITKRHSRRPYDLLHVHNMPDFLVFAAWYPKLTGAKVILDIHDIVPEFYGNKFTGWSRGPTVLLLKRLERVCATMTPTGSSFPITSGWRNMRREQRPTASARSSSIMSTHRFSNPARERVTTADRLSFSPAASSGIKDWTSPFARSSKSLIPYQTRSFTYTATES